MVGLRRGLAVLAAALLLAAAGSSQEQLEHDYVNCPSWVSLEVARSSMNLLKDLLKPPFTYEYEPENRRFRVTATPTQLAQMAELGFGRGPKRCQLAYARFKAEWERATRVEVFNREGGERRARTLEGSLAQATVAAVFKAFDEGFGVAFCFNPHHGLSADIEGHRYELLICYECGNARASVDGKEPDFSLATSDSSRAALSF